MSALLRATLSLAVLSLISVDRNPSVTFAQTIPPVYAEMQGDISSGASTEEAATFPNVSPRRTGPVRSLMRITTIFFSPMSLNTVQK